MSHPLPPGPDAHRTRLRATVAALDLEIARLSIPTSPSIHGATHLLSASWADLVEQLALGPEPETRNCPECGQSGMAAATRCGYCWANLRPRDDFGRATSK